MNLLRKYSKIHRNSQCCSNLCRNGDPSMCLPSHISRPGCCTNPIVSAIDILLNNSQLFNLAPMPLLRTTRPDWDHSDWRVGPVMRAHFEATHSRVNNAWQGKPGKWWQCIYSLMFICRETLVMGCRLERCDEYMEMTVWNKHVFLLSSLKKLGVTLPKALRQLMHAANVGHFDATLQCNDGSAVLCKCCEVGAKAVYTLSS